MNNIDNIYLLSMTSIAERHHTTHALAKEVLKVIPDTYSESITLSGAEKKHEELREQAKNFLALYKSEFAGVQGLGKRTTTLTADEAGLLVHWVDNLIQFKLKAKLHSDKANQLEQPSERDARIYHQEAAGILNTTINGIGNNLCDVFTNFGNLQSAFVGKFKTEMQAIYDKAKELSDLTDIKINDIGMNRFVQTFGLTGK